MKKFANSFYLLSLFAHPPVFSADLLLFDNPSITAMEHNKEIRAHYLGRSNKSYLNIEPDFSITCEFLFKEFYRTSDAVQISGWGNAIFMPDDPYLTYGLIRIHDGTWKIIFEDVPRGCRSKGDGDKLVVQPSPCCNPADLVERGGLYVRPVQRIRAVGFRILNKDHAFIKPDPGTSPPDKQRIGRGSVVAVLKLAKSTAYVRYVVPSTGEIVHGWMDSDALADPFRPYKATRK